MDTGQRESAERKVGSATYRQVGDDYLAQRTLQKSAGWVMLWALGVAAVISGDFFGWNYGLATGGFGGLLIATVFMAIMYVCMVLCIAELSTALPFAGGFYAFTRSAMGPSMAFVNTVTDIVEYVVTPAVVVISIAAYADNIVDLPNWVWWVGFYALFVGINMWGTKLSFRVSFIAAILAMGVLVFFYLAAIFSGAWSPDLLNNVPVDTSRAGASTFLPLGWFGVLASFPFAIWFYLAIEQLPLAAEESTDIVRDMPKALIWGIVTLLGFSVFTLVFNTGIAGGAAEVGSSLEPVMLGFRAIFGDGIGTTFWSVS
jgi:ethanolamine permease